MPGKPLSALLRLQAVARTAPGVIVMFSGGRDSLATLDLCARAFDRVVCAYLWVVPGLRCVEGPLERACENAGAELVRLPHWTLIRYMQAGTYNVRTRGHHLKQLRWVDMEEHLREVTGLLWVASGSRADDSWVRRLQSRRFGTVNHRSHRLTPLHDWRAREVSDYLRARSIPAPPPDMWGQKGARSQGFELTRTCLGWLRAKYPQDYQRVLEWFPLAEVMEHEPEREDSVRP